MFLIFWLDSCQIIWWKSRLLICLAGYSVLLRIFFYRISSFGSAVCSVIVLPHTGSMFCYCNAPHRQYVLLLYCPTPAVCSVIVLPHTGSVFCYCTAPHRQCVLLLYCPTPAVCSVFVLSHTSLWIPQSCCSSFIKWTNSSRLYETKLYFVYLFICLLFVWQRCRRVRLCRVDWWDDVWVLNLKGHIRYQPWRNYLKYQGVCVQVLSTKMKTLRHCSRCSVVFSSRGLNKARIPVRSEHKWLT